MLETRVPRTEAGVLQPDEMTEQQSAALSALMAYLRAIAATESGAREPAAPWRFLPRVDKKRQNHVFLINGKRGSGKSSLLLTLIHLCNRRLVEPDADLSGYGDAMSAADGQAPIVPPIVPVGLVDLQPIDPETNLILHLVGQLKPLVEVMQQSVEMKPPASSEPSWLEPLELPCVAAWRAFMVSAAASWNANMNARKAELDTEALVMEVEHTERYRLDVPHRFKAFVDALVTDYCAWQAQLDKSETSAGGDAGVKKPLFVIAVDDADMNPSMASELLDLLRVLWHERVAFVLTGDSDLFLDTVQDRLRLQSLIPAGGTSPLAVSLRSRRRVPHEELARNIYDKVIPEPHRLELGELSAVQRMEVFFRVVGGGGISVADLMQLRQLQLASHRFHHAIPGRLREIQDLGVALGRANQTMSERLRIWLEHVTRDERQHANVWYGLHGDDKKILEIHAPDLVWDYRAVPERALLHGHAGQLVIPSRFDLEFVPRQKFGEDGDAISENPSALIAVLEVAARAQVRGDDVVVHVGHRDSQRIALAEVRYREAGFKTRWQLPPWTSWLDAHQATQRWSDALKGVPREESTGVSWYAYVYLSSIASMGEPERKYILQYILPERLDNDAWTSLAQRVAALAQSQQPDEHLRSWARTLAGLMAAPESGLPRAEANRWLRAYRAAIEKAADWASVKKEMRTARIENLAKMKGFDTWIAANFRGYELFEEPPRAEMLSELESALKRIELPRIALLSDGNSWNHKSLNNALHSLPMRMRNLSLASQDLQQRFTTILSRYSRVRGTSERAVLELWSAVIAQYPHYRDRLTIDQDDHGKLMTLSLKHLVGEHREFHLGPTEKLVVRRARYSTIAELDDDAPPEMDAVARILSDMIIDGRDGLPADQCAVSIEHSWPYLTWLQGEHAYTLPVPGWRGLFDWETMQVGWNQLMDQLFPMELEQDPLMPQRVLVHLIYWFLDSMFDVLSTRETRHIFSLEASDLNWQNLGQTINKYARNSQSQFLRDSKVEHSHRLAVVAQWARRISTLCTARNSSAIYDLSTGSRYLLPPSVVEQLGPHIKHPQT